MTTPPDLQRRLARLDRLRRLGVHRGTRDLPPPTAAPAAAPDDLSAANLQPRPPGFQLPAPGFQPPTVLPGEPVATPFGPAWQRTVRYPLAEHPELAGWPAVRPEALAALDRNQALMALDPARVAFIDTETTGLSLGTGTYTFLIGVGVYEMPEAAREETGALNGAFVVRQFFMRNPAEEAAQLYLVEDLLAGCAGIVSFNGRGFDMPLITNRFVLAGRPPPLVAAPHLDLLPPARRAWRARWGACSLGSLERNVLGLRRSAEDVPGYLIPDIYRQYYLTGVASEMLVRVFYHNLQDIVSMVLLAQRLAAPFDRTQQAETLDGLHPLECLSLGRCYDALEWAEAAVTAYRRALAGPVDNSMAIEARRALGALLKRLERREEAVAVWEEWIGAVPGDDITPYLELAKHHEWRTGDLQAARGWAAWAQHIVETWPPGATRDVTLADLQHRLARLETKMKGSAA